MPDSERATGQKPVGVFVTLKEIHQVVLTIDDKLDSEIRNLTTEIGKLKAQLAAQWVIHAILVTALGFVIQRGLLNV